MADKIQMQLIDANEARKDTQKMSIQSSNFIDGMVLSNVKYGARQCLINGKPTSRYTHGLEATTATGITEFISLGCLIRNKTTASGQTLTPNGDINLLARTCFQTAMSDVAACDAIVTALAGRQIKVRRTQGYTMLTADGRQMPTTLLEFVYA